jgi:hypothetical protein
VKVSFGIKRHARRSRRNLKFTSAVAEPMAAS